MEIIVFLVHCDCCWGCIDFHRSRSACKKQIAEMTDVLVDVKTEMATGVFYLQQMN